MSGETGYSAEAALAMLWFSLASSSLLLINKLCLHHFPMPAVLSTIQFITASTTAVTLMATGTVPRDHFEWRKVKPYLVYVAMFVATIYANMRALQHSNVETIIVFRACCPLVVCLLDWGFLGRQLPSARSTFALLVVAGGCAGYVLTDRAFKLNGWGAYTWVSAYFCIISVEMAYGKYIVGPHLQFASTWGPTLYTNAISTPPMLTIALATGEQTRWGKADVTAISISLVVASCIVGVAISYLGWRARSLVTATCYTVLGVANKMLTVLANAMVWEQRASIYGIAFLMVCLLGAAAYQQAPLAEPAETAESASGASASSGRAKRRTLFILTTLFGGGAVAVYAANSAATPPLPIAAVAPPSPLPISSLTSLGADEGAPHDAASARHHSHSGNHSHMNHPSRSAKLLGAGAPYKAVGKSPGKAAAGKPAGKAAGGAAGDKPNGKGEGKGEGKKARNRRGRD